MPIIHKVHGSVLFYKDLSLPYVNKSPFHVLSLIHFMPLISFDTPWKHQKISGFYMMAALTFNELMENFIFSVNALNIYFYFSWVFNCVEIKWFYSPADFLIILVELDFHTAKRFMTGYCSLGQNNEIKQSCNVGTLEYLENWVLVSKREKRIC